MATELQEKREKLQARRDDVSKVFTEAKTDDGGLDFRQVKAFGKEVEGNSVAIAEKLDESMKEIDELSAEVEKLAKAESQARNWEEKANQPKTTLRHPTGETKEKSQTYDRIGTAIVNAVNDPEGVKAALKSGIKTEAFECKTLFQTSAGWTPESIRSGRVIEAVTRPIQLLDLVEMGTTSQSAFKYMEETTRTHAATEIAEAALYPEAAFELTERTQTVEKIATSIPVTDEQLQDVEGIESYLNNRLTFGLRQRLDSQVLNGDGVTPNLQGILNVTGIQTQAKGTDPVFDAVFKAMTKVRVTGRAQPSAIVLHPNDWQDIRLKRTEDGVYILGNPSDEAPTRLFGLPVAQSDAIVENTGLLGDFATFFQVFERRGIEVEVSNSHSDFFTKGKQMIRADMRAVNVTFRPAAFATITGI